MNLLEQQTKVSQLALSMLCGGDYPLLVNQLLEVMTPHELITSLGAWIRISAGLIRSSQETNFIPRYDSGLIRQQFNMRLSTIAKASPDAMLAALNMEK